MCPCDHKEVQALICSYIHKVVINEPNLAKLLSFQVSIAAVVLSHCAPSKMRGNFNAVIRGIKKCFTAHVGQ